MIAVLGVIKTVLLWLWLGIGVFFCLMMVVSGILDAVATILNRKQAIRAGQPREPGDMASWWCLLWTVPFSLMTGILAGLGAMLSALPVALVLGLVLMLVEWMAS